VRRVQSMRIVVLTSEIYDGKVCIEELYKHGKHITGIIHEKSKSLKYWLKTFIKSLIAGITSVYLWFPTWVVPTDDMNQEAGLIKQMRPDLMIVVGTKKLKPEIFNIPPLGTINVHTGILPEYRGSDSEFWAVYNRDDKIGVSIHYMEESLDTGDVILDRRQTLMGYGHVEMHKINIWLAAEVLNEAVDVIAAGKIMARRQDESKAHTYKRVSKEMKKKLLEERDD